MENITMKDLEGKEVFLRPTGNNRRPSNPKEIIAAKIIKVARVYATFIMGDLLFVESTARKIVNTFPYAQHYEKLDMDTITKVAVLLGIDICD